MRRLAACALAVLAIALIPTVPASADVVGGVGPEGTIQVAAWVHVGPTSKGGGPPACTWHKLTRIQVVSIAGKSWDYPQRPDNPPDEDLTPEELVARDGAYAIALANDRLLQQSWATLDVDGVPSGTWRVNCRPGTTNLPIIVAPISIPTVALGEAIYDYAKDRVPEPIANTSPAFDINAFVNIGLWLAVEPQTMEAIGARAVDEWMTVQPVLASLRWEFTQGRETTVVECDGFGDPIKDMNVREQSQRCGHTYTKSTLGAGPVDITVTSIWDLPYTSSGGTGTLGTIERSITATQTVNEVQVFGTGD